MKKVDEKMGGTGYYYGIRKKSMKPSDNVLYTLLASVDKSALGTEADDRRGSHALGAKTGQSLPKRWERWLEQIDK